MNHKHHKKCNCNCNHDNKQVRHKHENCNSRNHHYHGEITVSFHEGAVICAAEREIPNEYGNVRDKLSSGLKALANWVEEQGGTVGHIKAFITEKAYSAMLSTTGGDVDIKETRKPKIAVKFAAIVFIISRDEFCHRVDEVLDGLDAANQ